MTASGLRGLFAVFAVVAVLFAVYAIPAWRTWLSLNTAAATTPGEVVDLRFEDRDVSYFYVIYRYTVNGQVYQHEQRVFFSQIDLVLERVPVRYALNDPSIAQLDAPFKTVGDLLIPGTYFGGGFLVIMLLALLFHGTRHLSNSELVAKGRLVSGMIVDSHGNMPERDGMVAQILLLLFSFHLYRLRRQQQANFRVKIHYSFISPLSQDEIVNSAMMVRNDLDQRSVPLPGTPVAVLFHTNRHFTLL